MSSAELWASGALVAGAALALELLRRVGGRWWRRMVALRRARRAVGGERRAEAVLAAQGWRVLERQPRRTMTLEVDGEPRDVELRADLLVLRRGRRMIAEVKTGDRAPRLTHRDTRRQLLEYRVAWSEVDGVLLVEPERERVREVRFPLRSGSRRFVEAALGGAAVAALLGGVMLWLWG